jgi:subtilisin family serine protease
MRRPLPWQFAALIVLLMVTTPWSTSLNSPTAVAGTPDLVEAEPTVGSNSPLYPAGVATLWPPAEEWWERGEELAEVYVITRDLAALHSWQLRHGLLAPQAEIAGQALVPMEPSSGILEHRLITLPANLVPKIIGIPGVTVVFEDPGAPEAFSTDDWTPTSVKSGQIHGAVDAWGVGVNGSGVKVAIVDSGIDFGHPDLDGTQARVDDSTSPWDGWPIMWDPRSSDIWLKDGAAYPGSGGSWYSDTATIDNDSNNDSLLDLTGFDVSGLPPSLSGDYHHGLHPDSQLKSRAGGEVTVLVVDDLTAGVYETVYIDFDRDGNFSEEKPMRKGNETAGLDTDSDGLWDQSGGLLYWISDGVNGIPYGPTYSARAGFQNRIAGAGNLTLFMINDKNDPGGNHGTLCASAVAAQAVVNNGNVKGMAPGAELIAVSDFYAGGSFLDAWRFLTEGYDGAVSTGDEAQIGSFSFGWSNVHNDGTDQMSLYVDWLTRVHAPETTFLVATGNGGHGYGTTASPGGSHGIISVGAFSSRIGEPHGGTWGDSAAWSNRGPNSGSRLDPDIVTVGWSATGDRTLNEVTNANSATTTWAGTSLATPVAAGLVALIYDAWMQENGVWPDSQTVRDLLMSTADDRGYDSLVQGGGWANVSRAVETIQGVNGSAWVTPAAWMPGDNHGAHRAANTNILLPGQSSWVNLTINGTGDAPVNLSWSGATLKPLRHFTRQWNSSTSLGWDGHQSNRPDLLIPIHIKGDANLSLPNGTSLVRARVALAGYGFDGDQNLAEENRVWVELMRWHDDDGDGTWFTDLDNDSMVDDGELEGSGEYSMVTLHQYTSGQVETRIGLPTERAGDGILLGVYRQNIRTNLMDPIPIQVDWTAFGPVENVSWLSPCSGNATLAPNGTHFINCRVIVPQSAIPGLRQEQVRIQFEHNGTVREWPLPVVVNVAAAGPFQLTPKPIDGNMSNQTLYSETWMQGAQRWGWRSESGDWKFITLDWPHNLTGDGAIVIDVDWPDNNLTDIDVHWMSENGHPYFLDDPAAYGPINLIPEVSSRNMDQGSGKYAWETSTGSSHEVLIAEPTAGLKQMMLHSAMHGVNTNDNPLNISVGYVGALSGSLTKVVDDWADAAGEETLTFGATLPLNVSSIEGFGWTQPVLLPTETATQDTAGSWSSSGYAYQFTVENAEMLKVEIDSLATRTDLDLGLYRDSNGNGVINWGSEQYAVSGNWNSDEELTVENPQDGTWWAVVHGYDVPNGTASFWLRSTIVAGDDLIIDNVTQLNESEISQRFPNGSSALAGATPTSAFDVDITYRSPDMNGIWEGFIVISLESGGSLRLGYDYRLEELPPILSFDTPLNGTRTNQSIPLTLTAHDYGGGFNLSSLNLNTTPLVDWANASFTVETLADRDGAVTDLADSWRQWNDNLSLGPGSHFVESQGELAIEAEETTGRVSALDQSAPEWLEVSNGSSSGGICMGTDGDSGWVANSADDGHRLDYSIDFQTAGRYYVWLRLKAPDSDGNSVHVGLDGIPLTTGTEGIRVISYNTPQWSSSSWGSNQTSQVTFDVNGSSRHVLNLWTAKDGVCIDQILLTDDWTYVPTNASQPFPLYRDLTLRSAWVNLTMPTDNSWRTFEADVTDVANRVNSTSIIVEHDDLSPPLILHGWDLLTNLSSPNDIFIQTDPETRLWLNGSEIPVASDGYANLSLMLHPTYWSVRDGDPNDVTTWMWTSLNEFELVALDPAGNWNRLDFSMAYDPWGASNINLAFPQIMVDEYSGTSSEGNWSLDAFTPPDSLNAKEAPLTISLSMIFDTKRVCIRMMDEEGIEQESGCTSAASTPWPPEDPVEEDLTIPLYMGEFEYLIPFQVALNQTNLSDGIWQLEIETLDWAGNWGSLVHTLKLDRTPPSIEVLTPAQNETLYHHRFNVNWNISEPAQQSLVLDGEVIAEFVAGSPQYSAVVELRRTGWHQLCILATDLSLGPDPNIATECTDVYLTPDAYLPTVTAAWNYKVVNTPTVIADLHLGPEQSWSSSLWDGDIWVVQNGSELSSGDLEIPVVLEEGLNQVRFEIEALESMYLFDLTVTLDTRSPLLDITSPAPATHTSLRTWNVTGTCESGLEVIITIHLDQQSNSCENGDFWAEFSLPDEESIYEISAESVDAASNLGTATRLLIVDRTAPRAALSWDEPDCEDQPPSTLFKREPVARCVLGLRVDFLDDDITFWALSIDRDRTIVHNEFGGTPELQSLIVDLSEFGQPGDWMTQLIVEDAAGNRREVLLDNEVVTRDSTLTAKVTAPGSSLNILLIASLLAGLYAFTRSQSAARSKWEEDIPTPLDPELFVDEVEVDEVDFDSMMMPSSQGPIGPPPSEQKDLDDADSSLLQQVHDISRKQAKGAGKSGQSVDDGSISDAGSENIAEDTKSSSDDEEANEA